MQAAYGTGLQQQEPQGDDDSGCYWLSVLPPALAALGCPALAPALMYEKGDNLFSQSTLILTLLFSALTSDVEVIDDEDWVHFPELIPEVKKMTGWEYSVAVCHSKIYNKWGVGISGSAKGRASAGKLALAVSICVDKPPLKAIVEEYYPAFSKLCLNPGYSGGPSKRRKVGDSWGSNSWSNQGPPPK